LKDTITKCQISDDRNIITAVKVDQPPVPTVKRYPPLAPPKLEDLPPEKPPPIDDDESDDDSEKKKTQVCPSLNLKEDI